MWVGTDATGNALGTWFQSGTVMSSVFYNGPTELPYTQVTDPLGQVTRYSYDGKGRLRSVIHPEVAGQGPETRYEYDDNDNLISVTDANGRSVTFTYDSKGNRTSQQDDLGNTITYSYSTTNQLLTETTYRVPDPDGTGPNTPNQPQTIYYVYDAEDHLRFIVSAEGRVTEYRYAANGQRIARISYTQGRFDLTGLTPTSVLAEQQLTNWLSGQNLSQTERTDYSYDFRGWPV